MRAQIARRAIAIILSAVAVTGLFAALAPKKAAADVNYMAAIESAEITCASSAPTAIAITGLRYDRIKVFNPGTTIVYLGGITTATSAAGYPLCSGGSASCDGAALSIPVREGPLYCRAASTTQVIRIITGAQ
jgi:hypothetical protein